MALILIISFCLFLDDLVAGIAKTKALLLEKANPNSRRSQQEITDELDLIVRKATSKYIYCPNHFNWASNDEFSVEF